MPSRNARKRVNAACRQQSTAYQRHVEQCQRVNTAMADPDRMDRARMLFEMIDLRRAIAAGLPAATPSPAAATPGREGP